MSRDGAGRLRDPRPVPLIADEAECSDEADATWRHVDLVGEAIPREERAVIHARAASIVGEEVERTKFVDLVPLRLLNMGLGADIERVVHILSDGGDLWVEALQRMGLGTPTERAQTLLSELAHFDPAEVRQELDGARAQVTPYTSRPPGPRTLGLRRRK